MSSCHTSIDRLCAATSLAAGVSTRRGPVANASMTFTITKANGTVATQTTTTATNGSTVAKLPIKSNDPPGTSQVRITTTVNGLSGSATMSFRVQ